MTGIRQHNSCPLVNAVLAAYALCSEQIDSKAIALQRIGKDRSQLLDRRIDQSDDRRGIES
jgi:hypothetical protein